MILIGTGDFSWFRRERVTDRYGTCYTCREHAGTIDAEATAKLRGHHGQLLAVVATPKQSGHIGDLFRGFSPSLPNVGERVVLGKGTFFSIEEEGILQVGLEPDDSRVSDWLDPAALYRCHSSEVKLYFVPDGPSGETINRESCGELAK